MNTVPTIYLAAEAAGGVARHVIDLYSGLKKKEWSVRLILSPTRMEHMFQAEIQQIPSSDLLLLPMRRAPHWSDAVVAARLRAHLRRTPGRYLLHAHSTKAGMLGAALRPWLRGSLYTPHAYRSVDPTLSALKRRVIQRVERTFTTAYDRVIAVAPAEFNHAIRLGVPAERVRHIPNGIHAPMLISRGRAHRPEAPVLGFVGRLAPQKNPVLFLKVLREVVAARPEARAIIVGDGPLKDEMRAYAHRYQLGPRIDWRGAVPFASACHEMDVQVHTSHYEAMPYTLVEGAAYGLPVVSTKNDGSAAVLGDLLPEAIVDSFDARVLAARVLALFSNPAELNRQAEGLRAVAGHYSLDRMVTSLEKEYETLLTS